METKTRQPKKHIGRNFRRMREMMGMKQEAVALKMDVTQQTISNLEQKETVNDEELNKMAEALGVTPDAIKSFDEETVVYNIQHNHEGSNKGVSNVGAEIRNYSCTFNALDKLIETIDENKKLYEELLKAEKEKNALLKEQLRKK
ncbi:helix-turn-helix domain-containing protein [Fulvivirgaceae bacterium BMA12]|uniref:Helix-turn-helix domain-containing protein n=1 Tax=Agaribacillus aureus TaxID=3051825 RepID=A0ABT8LBF8_9BACT|nr:helix-turn-helix domain-containing protein [Fulvivirgaceae bacterium BMA12]